MSFISSFTKLVVFLNMTLTLLLMILLIYAYTRLADNFFLVFDPQNTIFIVFLTALFFIMLLFIYGILAISKQQIYSLTLFIILSFICGSLQILVANTAQLQIPLILGSDCLSTSTNRNINKLYMNSTQIFCVTCPCYFPQSINTNVYTEEEIKILQEVAPRLNITNKTLATSIFSCPEWNNSYYPKESKLFKTFEQKFGCSGWCNNSNLLFYLFTNVNNGIPVQNCYDMLSNLVNLYGQIIYLTAYGQAGAILLGMIFTSIFLYEIRKKKQEREIIYIFSTDQAIMN